MTMSNKTAANALAFLRRVELKGSEAGAFLEVLQAVNDSTEVPEQLDIEDTISEADGN